MFFFFKVLQSKLDVKKSAKQMQDLIVAGKSRFTDLYWRNIQLQIHLDRVSAQMDHSRSIWGPILIVNFLETHTGPKSLHCGPRRVFVLGQSGTLGPCRPKADIYGGRRPTLRGCLRPPTVTSGGVGGR